ncbi:UDP-3-O-(3-hydroxymyristoyl)glucosamine N-acyltransferase [Solimonas sp. K1W22B-7]|uniref:UDP-3-O-(3-hydroxymyristoyl)glucosamine N-acyltransferase n=1 Tax=Solimonas sp. K1W22B-7 TaxID=2303331 RepID=UPI000E333665|nr:UDP-3-O-(3-hydroxymyristoyl)glucosamine N-acyltransferase [Solimonas sp. K1W22B-7]AXQ28982.1 UDP-3-O-(3-hydroxymyristoyl)glucosamine N-acyltransferase [Solimonas sp. K1W22B-7]
MTTHSLADLAARFGLELKGEGATAIQGVCALNPGKPGCIGFLSNPKYREQLAGTQAAAVIVGPRDAEALTIPGLVAKDPFLAYARLAQLFDPDREFAAGVHPGAMVSPAARLGSGVHVGAGAVIEAGAQVGDGSYIGPGCVIGRDAQIGEACRLVAQVHVGARVRLGRRCTAQPGAVIGSRGFGNVPGPEGWEEIPQLGSVVVGDNVEIGANTCIDRGAIDDTVIEDGVRLDNLIQIAHNVRIGRHTAIAACTGIAGSTRIGSRCFIGGAVGIAGHLTIADDVSILGRAMVTHSIPEKGVYGSGLPLSEAREWRKTVARIRRLPRLEERLREVERQLQLDPREQENDSNES